MMMFECLMNANYFENLFDEKMNSFRFLFFLVIYPMMMMKKKQLDNENYDFLVWEFLHQLMWMNIVYDVIELDRNDEMLAN